jgi:phenylacetate-CoA ligase
MMGPGVAQECIETKDGPTIWEDHFYPEIIDPDTGKVLPDGEEGELVFTSLSKEAMPMIRYRTRDLTRLLPGSARTMRRMDKITGRSDDMLIIRGVNVFPSQIEEQVCAIEGLTPHYLIEIKTQGNMDKVTIRVESDPRCSTLTNDYLINLLSHKVKTFIGISATIVIEAPQHLPRSEGKAKRVIDHRS